MPKVEDENGSSRTMPLKIEDDVHLAKEKLSSKLIKLVVDGTFLSV